MSNINYWDVKSQSADRRLPKKCENSGKVDGKGNRGQTGPVPCSPSMEEHTIWATWLLSCASNLQSKNSLTSTDDGENAAINLR